MVHKVQLLISTLLLTAIQPVLAQGMEAGAMQSMTPSSSIGPEQDSLLPPEVVPLDPSAVSQMQSRQVSQGSMNAMQSSNVPGLSQPQVNPMELRRQALGQLTGDQMTIPPSAMKPWRAGQLSQATAPGTNPGQMSSSMPAISGMPPGVMPPGIGMAPQSQPGAPNYQMANNNQASNSQGYIAQSQTLTGGAQNQPQQQNTHRGGFSNKLSGFSTMGLGMLANPFMSGFMMRRSFLKVLS